MKNKNNIQTNFGLAPLDNLKRLSIKDSSFDHWFWESKSKKKLKAEEKRAEINQMNMQTAAMQRLISEQMTLPSGINVGKIALIGGLIVLLGVGAVLMLKKKKGQTGNDLNLKAEDLIV